LTHESAAQKLTAEIQPCPLTERGELKVTKKRKSIFVCLIFLISFKVIPVQHILIRTVSAVRIYMPDDLRTKESRENVLKNLQDLQKQYPFGLPLLDPMKDMGIKTSEMINCIKQYSILQSRLNEHPLRTNSKLIELYKQYECKANIEKQVFEAKNELKKAQSLLQIGDLKKYKRILRRLGYCNAADVIDLKGRVACEIDTGDELVTTELLFNGVFNDLTVSQACALLSCFVFQEKANEMPKLPPELAGPLRQLQVQREREKILLLKKDFYLFC